MNRLLIYDFHLRTGARLCYQFQHACEGCRPVAAEEGCVGADADDHS